MGGVLDHAGVERWLDAYDAAGIQSGARPPAALVQMARDATHLVASDMPRALASAEALGSAHEIRVSELFREAPLAIPRWPTRLPLLVWGALIHAAWSYRIARGVDETDSIGLAPKPRAEWLTALVADGSTAVVVTHGVFRRLLGNPSRASRVDGGSTRAEDIVIGARGAIPDSARVTNCKARKT